MSEAAPRSAPGWQTEELQEEWIEMEAEEESENDDDNLSYGTRSISLTAPLNTHIHTTNAFDSPTSNTSRPVGTFLVREDMPHAPFVPKTPGRNKKGFVKDFFTPLHLERMFEPPSPPEVQQDQPITQISSAHLETSRSDEILETDMPNMNSFHGRRASIACQFTFSMPRDLLVPVSASSAYPQAQSTPNPPFVPSTTAPATDPRLRLFQFQYDTYTRDHLSALVDSIAVNTPSGTGSTPSPTNFTHGLSRVSEVTNSVANVSHLRSSKRVKLSAPSDFYGEGVGAGASVSRPKLYGKDYVGESQSLMQQIKQARDFSTISTVVSAQTDSPSNTSQDPAQPVGNVSQKHSIFYSGIEPRRPSYLSIPENTSRTPSLTSGTVNSMGSGGSYSSTTYRQQAAALMAQIRSDMKGPKRIFSGDTDISFTTHAGGGLVHTRSSSIESLKHEKPIGDKTEKQRRAGHRRTSSSRSNSSQHKSSLKTHQQTPSNGDVQALDQSLFKLLLKSQPTEVAVLKASLKSSALSSQADASLKTVTQPSYPSYSVRGENLNRFVSSSTASGTTLTSGPPSFVKHAGPPHIKTITPGDIPALPERLGDMYYDKVLMKWVKSTAHSAKDKNTSGISGDELSEDPFGDIESLRDDSRGREGDLNASVQHEELAVGEMSRIEEQSEVEDNEEMELTSFSTDASAHVVNVMTGIDDHDLDDGDETTDSADDLEHTITQSDIQELDFDTEDEGGQSLELHNRSQHQIPQSQTQTLFPSSSTANLSTPNRGTSILISTTPIIRSALKSHNNTPNSALKDTNRRRYETPSHKLGHMRSVSFSDGKRDGPIRELQVSDFNQGSSTSAVVQSVRSKRIADMMDALEDSDLEESPSKTSSTGRPEELRSLTSRRVDASSNSPRNVSPRRAFTRSRTHRSPVKGKNKADATFLTECSFGVSHDRLVEAITDVQPFEPYWEELSSVNLSGKKLESAARLKEFLPKLDSLNLNSNELSWLSGVPGCVRTLSVASNRLTGMSSYSHLLNLENLDISYNDVDSLRQLDCLRHLRELKADGNRIASTDGLQKMDGLVKLSLQNNSIGFIDLAQHRWNRLEMLNISQNRLNSIRGLASLQALIALNMDKNQLKELEVEGVMLRLRILRISGNRLQQLNVSPMPNLRTLYADNNSLPSLVKVARLTKLENLSLRNQSGRGFNLLTRDVRDVKRLYLSGNPLSSGFLQEPCYNLVYLELAACRLTSLPEGLSGLVPNLRVLNLNYNFLEDARPLEGLTRLQKLTIIGSRLKNTKPLIRLLQRMPDVEMLDFRMNPCTLGWYLPLLVKDVPGALQPSEGGSEGKGERAAAQAWQELDSKFRRDLPDKSYIGRLAYRGLIMRGCPRVRMVDGVGVTEKERKKAQELLAGILGRR